MVTAKETKDDNQLILEAGKPMIYGAENNKGIVLKGTRLETVVIGENGITEADLLVHDPSNPDPGIHVMLSKMQVPEFPVALGIIRAVETDTYEDLMTKSISFAKQNSPIKCVDDLLMSGSTWEI